MFDSATCLARFVGLYNQNDGQQAARFVVVNRRANGDIDEHMLTVYPNKELKFGPLVPKLSTGSPVLLTVTLFMWSEEGEDGNVSQGVYGRFIRVTTLDAVLPRQRGQR